MAKRSSSKVMKPRSATQHFSTENENVSTENEDAEAKERRSVRSFRGVGRSVAQTYSAYSATNYPAMMPTNGFEARTIRETCT